MLNMRVLADHLIVIAPGGGGGGAGAVYDITSILSLLNMSHNGSYYLDAHYMMNFTNGMHLRLHLIKLMAQEEGQ